ncbi:unnamed protein product [Brassica oleracea var. botrytis]
MHLSMYLSCKKCILFLKKLHVCISIPETVTTNGIGAELSRVYAVTGANNL